MIVLNHKDIHIDKMRTQILRTFMRLHNTTEKQAVSLTYVKRMHKSLLFVNRKIIIQDNTIITG